MCDKTRVLLLDALADRAELGLQLLEIEHIDLMAVFDMSLDCILAHQIEMAPQHLKLLVGQDLVEEEVARVIWIQLNLQTVCVRICQGRIEKFDKHGEVVSELGCQILLCTHLRKVENVARVLIAEEVVTEAKKLDFDDLGVLLWPLRKNLNPKLLSLLDSVPHFLNELLSDYVKSEWALSFVDDSEPANFKVIKRILISKVSMVNLLRLGSPSAMTLSCGLLLMFR